MKTQLIAAALLILALFGLQATPAGAAWSNDPDENNPICVATDMQAEVGSVSDGAGGAIIAWTDKRSGYSDIYAQRIDATGVTLWGSGGVPVCTATLDCQPSTGVVPFVTRMTVSMDNLYTEQVRRFAARVNVQLAGGASYPNWRAGSTNVAAGDTFTMSWNQNIPALGTLIGNNVFSLVAQDVTPAPYNQPPYPPSGDTAADACTVTAMMP